ncbi:unnamed protein product, partial [marine sediment metagenome]
LERIRTCGLVPSRASAKLNLLTDGFNVDGGKPLNRQIILIGIGAVVAVVGGIVMLQLSQSEDAYVNENIISATSLEFKVDFTVATGQPVDVHFWAKNIGSPDVKIRVDGSVGSTDMDVIVDVGTGATWMRDTGSSWGSPKPPHNSELLIQSHLDMLEQYQERLSDWVEGDHYFTAEGATIRIYDIEVNPDLPDSLFLPDS